MASSKVPSFMIILCLLLGANEIYWVISVLFFNPLGYLLLGIIALAGVVIYQSGLWPGIKAVLNPIINQLVGQVKGAIGLEVKTKKD